MGDKPRNNETQPVLDEEYESESEYSDSAEYESGSEEETGSGSEYSQSGEEHATDGSYTASVGESRGSEADDEDEPGGSGDSESSSDQESGTETESSSEHSEVEEPKLKYQRLGAGVTEILKTDSASCLVAHEKFLVLGTHNGCVHILDFNGYEIKRFALHSSTVNDVSVDISGDFIASCSNDGKVVIINLFSPDSSTHSYHRPVTSVALHPQYGAKTMFATGGRGQQFIINTKGWFSSKDNVLHAGEGPIHAVRWKGDLIAWANDLGVKIYDCATTERITWIGRPKGSPSPDKYHCSLCWESETTLLIGWADSVKVGVVKTSGPGEKRGVVIVSAFQTDFYISGIAPFNDRLVLLAFIQDDAYSTDEESYDGTEEKTKPSLRPELRIITRTNEDISSDALPINGFEKYIAKDYRLDCLTGTSESLFYIVSPKDIVVAKPRDVDDHIEWLLEDGREQYAEALAVAKENSHALVKHKIIDIGERYLDYLISTEDYEPIPELCPELFKDDVKKWEFWISVFAKRRILKVIIPCIPTEKPRLSNMMYEMVLSHFLTEDHEGFLRTIRTWPVHIYDVGNIINGVIDKLNESDSKPLMDALGELYERSGQYDYALGVYLRLKHGNVFDLIEKHDLFDKIKDKVLELMQFDKDKAIELFQTHVDRIPVGEVVHQLDDYEKFQHEYLHELFLKDNFAGSEFHDLQVKLYAEYDPDNLLTFLRLSNFYVLENALNICKEKEIYGAQVFILGRMGNTNDALSLIIQKLHDVKQAIEFVEEHKDDGLWDELIKHSLKKPDFVSGLLEHIGAHHRVDPIKLISKIPETMEIEGLRDKLVKIMSEYLLEMSLRQGSNNILKADCISLLQRLNRAQKQAVRVNMTNDYSKKCASCDIDLLYFGDGKHQSKEYPPIIAFFCGHVYHADCLHDHEAQIKGRNGNERVRTQFVYDGSDHKCFHCLESSANRHLRKV